MLKRLLPRGEKGIGAVEFALVAPVFIAFIVGISQLGRLFYANADMKNAAAHAGRLASIYRTEGTVDDATLIAAVRQRLLREGASARVNVTVTRGTDDGNPYVELHTTYSVPLEFIFFSTPPVTLHDTRRVFTQVVSANGTTYSTSGTTSSTSSASTGTTSTTSSTTSGGTTSTTSASSTGGTSATSASSTGGSTSTSASSTSASSTSSTSTSSTSTSSTSSGSNASSGSNNGSSGHAHGNCSKCG